MAHVWELFLSAAAAGLLLLAATAAGRAAAVRLLPGGTPFAVQTIFGAGLGLGLLGYLTLGAGLAGFASPLSCLVILALVFGASIREILELLRRASAAGVRSFRLELGPAEAAAFAILGAFLAVTLLGALSPPFYYDGLVYHLSVPKLHLLRGFVGHVPENVHAQYPSLAQMLYLLALGLRDDIAVKLLNFGIGLALAAAVYLFGRTFADRATGAWAAVIVLTTEAVAMTLTRVMIDAATALFPFLALFAIALWDRDECRNPRLLLLAGLLGGLAISTKYTDFWLWAILLAAVALLALKRGRGAAAILPPLLAGGTSLIVLLPWLMKTGSWTGNPVFPFFFDLLGGRPWDAWAQERFAAYNAGMGGPISWRSIYRTPLEMFLIRGSMENLTLGALFLLALPFVLADRSRPRAFALAGAVLLAYVPYWFLSARIVRYLVLVVPCAALLVAHARTALVPGSRAHRALGAVLIAGMLHNLAFFAVDELTVFEPVAVALGAETREAFLSRKLQPYEAMRFASRTLPRDAKVFFIGETRGYHLDRDYIANSAHDPSLLAALVRRTRDAGGVARELRALGVTHLLYHPGEAVRLEREYRTFNWQPGETRIVEELLTRHARELHRANGVALLELR